MDFSEKKKIIPEYNDIWRFLHPSEPGYTWPRRMGFFSFRPDKIIAKKSDTAHPVDIKILGSEPIPKYKTSAPPKEGFVITPSDHYGLMATI
eukprot:CAMPEP_0114583976 /NCGR_PEP_ID=MMETSP0125-20121206/7660_1 /TAXON_ID=485358 ORGANISM="Aristerostoma sp., Strain ATCC 50986" /NCGR_SAMPLE_ID=MMETSP0125 /ASSEMBLY_ACC=CAM_ASM_000245 /LENGTH=91 /DNA_ID=CAMNT_0001777873 /DNA_START=565 /DNA_END=840 /DNA_ORIENTATION=-